MAHKTKTCTDCGKKFYRNHRAVYCWDCMEIRTKKRERKYYENRRARQLAIRERITIKDMPLRNYEIKDNIMNELIKMNCQFTTTKGKL